MHCSYCCQLIVNKIGGILTDKDVIVKIIHVFVFINKQKQKALNILSCDAYKNSLAVQKTCDQGHSNIILIVNKIYYEFLHVSHRNV